MAGDYVGFERRGPSGTSRVDGVIRRVQPDVAIMLELLDSLGLPTYESMTPVEARAFSDVISAQRPPGPEVGELVDGTLPGPAGELAYRLYRPATTGPHPIIVYFHGGGWVLGSETSDDPFCRDLCVRTDAVVVSVNYRHAPEDRFPAPVEDALAAVRWVADHAGELGGDAGWLAVAGWSAGANLAAVISQLARDAGGPHLAGQLLVTPVTDADPTRPSFEDNGTGYLLTADLMRWFWDHYADPADRTDPRAGAAAGRSTGRAAARRGRDGGVRPVARRGDRVRRGPGGGRCARPPHRRRRSHAHVAPIGRPAAVGSARACLPAEALRSFLGVPVPA